MPLRIGFDMDGVLADLNSALAREAIRLFPGVEAKENPADAPTAPVPADGREDDSNPAEVAPPSLRLSPRQERALWDAVKAIPNFWETLNETEPGIVARLHDTARARRWEVIFLTSRPRCVGDVVQLQSQRWLERHGFPLPALYVVSTSRGKIAQALELDVVVDDRPENCLDIALDSKARAILIWRGDENAVPANARRLGIGGVSSVGACLDLLVEADSPDTGDSGGMMGRLRKLLRLKPAARTEPSRA
jgi:hypothetical protein